MADYTAHVDTFARDNLPPHDRRSDFLFDRPELQYPARLNCAVELLDKNVQAGIGDRPVILAPRETWTYADLLDRANRIARVLTEDLGLAPGNRVLLHAPNNPMLVACWFAVVKAGGIVVATMPLLRARELAMLVDKAEVSLALCDERLADELAAAQVEAPRLERIVHFNGSRELEGMMADKSPDFANIDTSSADTCLIAYTSGTTGVPKGTMHFHRDVMAICDCFPRSILKPRPEDIFCGSPPIAFTFGLGGLVTFPMRIGASTLLLEQAPPDVLLQAIEDFKATILFTAPTGYRAMLDKMDDHDVTSLRRCVSAGETLPLTTWQAWHGATGIRIIDGIGTTEMLHIFISAADDDIRPGATGKPVPGYEARIVDDNHEPLPPGETGRLAVRGPTGCRYLADERQTSYVVDGWNLTGAAYRMDEDGYFWFQARTDDMIVSSGYNISGPEVEEGLYEHDAVSECACVASPDSLRGNVVKAFIVLAQGAAGSDALVKALQDFVKERIAPYKYPRAIEFVDKLPRTETGKLQRFKLREREVEPGRPQQREAG